MSRIAFIFPGQGAQKPGMGKDFCDKYPEAEKIFETASERTGLDMKALCFEENDKLNLTEYTQAAILTTSAAIMRVVEKSGLKAEVCAGLSLGEYNALVAAGVMSFEDAVMVVRQRGIFMQEAVPAGEGAMTAVLGLENECVEKICEEIEDVWVANYNCPGQIVISGKKQAVQEAERRLKEAGAKRCLPLNVSGPFHSGMLLGAGEKLAGVLDSVTLKKPQIPYVTNVTAEYVTEKDDIRELLARQVSSGVRWQQSVERMIEDGIDTFIELGPGKTLSGFVKKINAEVRSFHIETVEDMKRVVEEAGC